MKKRYDQKSKGHNYHVADVVYLYIPMALRKGGRKLACTFSGPYLISRVRSKTTVDLRDLQSGRILNRVVHVERLRKPSSAVSAKAIYRRLEMRYGKKRLDPETIVSTPLSAADQNYLRTH